MPIIRQSPLKTQLFGTKADVGDNLYAFGLRYVVPMSTLARPWVAGGLYKHAEIEGADGALVADSRHTLGWEAR